MAHMPGLRYATGSVHLKYKWKRERVACNICVWMWRQYVSIGSHYVCIIISSIYSYRKRHVWTNVWRCYSKDQISFCCRFALFDLPCCTLEFLKWWVYPYKYCEMSWIVINEASRYRQQLHLATNEVNGDHLSSIPRVIKKKNFFLFVELFQF